VKTKMASSNTSADQEFQRWSTEIKRGAVSLAIMAVLHDQPAYGYEIVKRLESKAQFLQLEQGTVYPLLRRLEKRDLLEATWNYEDPQKPKKYYAATDQGKIALQKMITAWKSLSNEMAAILKEVGKYEN
jgi:DNA-binding PadR family transcriptional regulator